MPTKTVRVARVFEVDVPVEYGDTTETISEKALGAIGPFRRPAAATNVTVLPGLSPVEVSEPVLRDSPCDVDAYSPDPTEG